MDRIMSWNVRGINNRHKQEEVKQMIFSMKVGLVGLLETKIQTQNLGSVFVNMFRGWCLSTNNAWHKGGRIMISWNPGVFTVNILQCTSQLMHLEVTTMAGKECFLVTFVYALNEEQGRISLWNDLKDIALKGSGPWIILGDFTDILSVEERIGGQQRPKISGAFKECVEFCQVEDVKYTCSFFTWNNKQNMETRIYSKIDRVLANQGWLDKFPNAEVVFLAEGMFDHCPAILTVYPPGVEGKKPFRDFRMWENIPDFKKRLEATWRIQVDGAPMFQLTQKLKEVKKLMKGINKMEFGDIHSVHAKRFQNLMDCQAALQLKPQDHILISKEKEARTLYSEAHSNYISFLKQKAKLHWMKEGDDNTSFFHSSI
ncbi:uncharacterized protein LOC133784591 [Humulus lupulus]|uniref:uncharacterized protein LOC133784591 n=1 Tax=Humulus lupulus TaxID=3486 RepID=UPI002B40530F|nr:uncharacterized protein LOC133784591 [Humulus lupulus]